MNYHYSTEKPHQIGHQIERKSPISERYVKIAIKTKNDFIYYAKTQTFFQPNKQNDQTPLIRSDQIELEPNASKFAIFSAVRSSVLESETKLSQIYGASQDVTGKSIIATCCCHCATTCKTGVSVECRCHHGQAKSQDNNDSENDSFTDDTTEKEIVLQVPQVTHTHRLPPLSVN